MELYAGLMSGTSLDGIDVALVSFAGAEERPAAASLVALHTEGYEPEFRARLRRACGEAPGGALSSLSFELGRRFARALAAALDGAGVEAERLVAVGSHGQTVWHGPTDPAGGHTLQIGEGAVIAERLGVPVVEDFRVRDVAAGGQGAPLTACFDRLLLASRDANRAIQNLGGMANVTGLPAEGSGRAPLAFDTGPGVALIDGAARRLSGGRLAFDEDGRAAARGTVDEAALAEWLEDPFFATPPPRTTGRERFGEAALERWLGRNPDLSLADALATLTELTARSAAGAYRFLGFEPREVYLCGGGARNPELRRRLEERLAPVPVHPLEALGWDGEAREAAAFALLARQHVLGFPVRLEWATGARGPRRLGKWVPA